MHILKCERHLEIYIWLFDLHTCVDLCLYISSHLLLCQKALQMSISKRERDEKALLRKLVWLGKVGAKMYSKCMMPKPKVYSSKKYKKFHGIVTQKLICIDQKVWEMEAKWKTFNQCKHFGGGHICSFN